MDQKLLNKAITISAKEEKLQGGKPVCKIKDEKGLTYTVYKTKQDGSESVAWKQLSELQVGDTVQIGYAEDLGEFQGKSITYRTIRNFNKDIGQGMINASANGLSPRGEASSASQGIPRDDRSHSIGVRGILQALLSNTSFQNDLPRYDHLINLAIEIDAELEKRLNPSSFRQAVQRVAPQVVEEPLPVIQQEEPWPTDEDLAAQVPF